MDDELIGLLTSLICILDPLWDSSKDQIEIWPLISDIIQDMLLLLEKKNSREWFDFYTIRGFCYKTSITIL